MKGSGMMRDGEQVALGHDTAGHDATAHDSADRIGLVLEGGAMRGMFTAGVMDVLMRARGVRFHDWRVGGGCAGVQL